jgi:2-oxoglutarate dehydrogenase E1 component
MRPLVIFTPKSLLRLPAASSRLVELAGGAFQPVLDDPERAGAPDAVTRLVLCSGKIYYDLMASASRGRTPQVAIARVEQLYPFPALEVTELLRRYPNLREVAWTQEEPWNMGARKFLMPDVRAAAPDGLVLREVARPERASPAEGYPAAHAAEQQRIVREALEG